MLVQGMRSAFWNLSNTISPTLLGVYVRPDLTVDTVRADGDRAYVAGESQLIVLDVHNPRSPTLLGQVASLLTDARDVQVVGNLAYVAHLYGVDIFDISNAAAPVRLGSYPEGANAVQVVGTRAYVAGRGLTQSPSGVSGRFDIVDVTNPRSPVRLGRYPTPGIVTAVHVAGGLAYLTSAGGLYVVDVSAATTPTARGSYATPGYPNALQVADDRVYVANIGDGTGGLEILRVYPERFFQSTATITADGGTLTSYDGAVRVSFPAGAVASAMTITYTGLLAPTVRPGGGRIAVRSFRLEARDGAGQSIKQFDKPYTMVISYTDAQLATLGVGEDHLNLAFWDDGAWRNALPCAGCSVDVVRNRLTATLNQLTEFALLGSPQHQVWLPQVRR